MAFERDCNAAHVIIFSPGRYDFVLEPDGVSDYLSSLTAHTCYWESEDTVYFILNRLEVS